MRPLRARPAVQGDEEAAEHRVVDHHHRYSWSMAGAVMSLYEPIYWMPQYALASANCSLPCALSVTQPSFTRHSGS